MNPLWLAQAGKWLLSKLTLRNILILLGLLVIAFAQYKFHNWSYNRGAVAQHEIDQKTIDRVTGERNKLQTKYDTYRSAFKTWVFRSELARLTLAKENQAIVSDIESRLKAEEQRSADLKRKLKDAIPHSIPPAVDFDLPRGFVRVWHDSFEGESGTAATADAGVAYGLGDDAARASGLKLSAFTAIGIDNNQECVARGQVIREWQGWYYKHKDLFEKVQKDAAASIPSVPAETPDGSQGSK